MVYIIKFLNSKSGIWWFCAREFDSEIKAIEYAKSKIRKEHIYSNYQIYKAEQL